MLYKRIGLLNLVLFILQFHGLIKLDKLCNMYVQCIGQEITGLFSMNAVPLISLTCIIEESVQFAPRFFLPYFLRENSTEQRDSDENCCEGNCFHGNILIVSSFFRSVQV